MHQWLLVKKTEEHLVSSASFAFFYLYIADVMYHERVEEDVLEQYRRKSRAGPEHDAIFCLSGRQQAPIIL
jgi:hypothetical protein